MAIMMTTTMMIRPMQPSKLVVGGPFLLCGDFAKECSVDVVCGCDG